MNSRTRSITLGFITALGLLLALPSGALAQQGPASHHLEQRHEEVMALMRRPATAPADRQRRTQEVTRILSQLLDYEELSRRALGAHWETRTPAQRTQFVGLLRQLVERQYEQNLERLVDFEVQYTNEAQTSDGTVVTTQARSRVERRQPPVEIAYSMRADGGTWRVFDVNTDGVSLVRNYQNQFNRIIERSGWDDLIHRMETRLANPAAE